MIQIYNVLLSCATILYIFIKKFYAPFHPKKNCCQKYLIVILFFYLCARFRPICIGVVAQLVRARDS